MGARAVVLVKDRLRRPRSGGPAGPVLEQAVHPRNAPPRHRGAVCRRTRFGRTSQSAISPPPRAAASAARCVCAMTLPTPLLAEPDDVQVVTFGCRLNAYESEALRARARADGVENAVVFNTCAVTNEAVRQARQAIRRARRERPGARLIVTGCAAQIDPQAFAAMAEVDLVLGNAEKSQAGAYASQPEPMRVRVNDIMSVRETAGHL